VVLGDGKELWKSDGLKKSEEAKPVTVDIKGVRKLVLRVNSKSGAPATDRRSRDQGDWIDAKLTRAGAAGGL
jgi:hypothetical protein